ncbi:MAG: glycosyltransferase family 39 protein [Candidatus Chisholmbacteria bacterium]|nr:glycosyltransferase family 39 protein [Candidatus Chisholmbacteria bacterium]
MKKLPNKSTPFIIALIALIVFAIGLNRPFAGHHDWNSAFYGTIARNHMRYGLLTTKLGLVTNAEGFKPHARLDYFSHHPVLLPIIMAFSFFLFGITEAAGRIVPLLSVVAMVYFIYKLAARLWHQPTAIIASLIAIATPMLRYYSKIPVNETVVLGFVAATVWFYYIWLTTNNSKAYLWSLVTLTLAQHTSWGGYYLSALLPLHAWFFGRAKLSGKTTQALSYGLIGLVNFLIFFFHNLALSGPQGIQSLGQVLLFRMNLSPASQIYGFTLSKFIELQARWLVIYFTRITIIFSALYTLRVVYLWWRHRSVSFPDSFLLLWLAFGFTQPVFLPNHAFIHDYDLIYATPFLTLTAGIMIYRITRRLFPRPPFSLLIPLVIIVAITIERQSYLQALHKTIQGNPGYLIGQALNQRTGLEDKILILNTELMQFYEVFLRFYADRSVSAANVLTPEIISEFDYIVIPSSHDYVSVEDKTFLYANFPVETIPGGSLFHIRHQPS